ncbi:dihydropteroate synthase [Sagittula sp. SSi028]|uniref:dihydropteroate synthase n=1 Tax=Sagittula sp. SSi028 TaxID=3400636 RepID=UPI003AF6187B
MKRYYRPIVRFDAARPETALPLAGGAGWLSQAICFQRGGAAQTVEAQDIPADWQDRLTAQRPPLAGLALDRTRVMGILNVTPDSFSDGGSLHSAAAALRRAEDMVEAGADILDVGGESTRPGAQTVPIAAEIARIEPVIRAIASDITVPISIDTRKSAVAEAAVTAGAGLVNDVSGFTYDPMLAHYCAREGLPVCVMHTLGPPETMQDNIAYDDVLLDVFDFLETQVQMLVDLGLSRGQIVVDPGIGFGKTIDHNLTLLRHAALFHGLGCPVLVGASRKGFIGTITGASPAVERVHGSVAVAQAMAAQAIQIVRVHDVAPTVQALVMHRAIETGDLS